MVNNWQVEHQDCITGKAQIKEKCIELLEDKIKELEKFKDHKIIEWIDGYITALFTAHVFTNARECGTYRSKAQNALLSNAD